MMSWLRKRNKEILLLTFGGFLIGGVAFTGYQGLALSPFSPVLVVNGDKVPYKRYEARLRERLAQEEGTMSPEKVAAAKSTTLQELVQEATFLQEAARYGLKTSDREVAAFIQSIPAFQRDGRFDQALYLSYLAQGPRVTPSVFEEDRRRDILRQKLMLLLSSTIRVSAGEMADSLQRVPAAERAALAKDPQRLRQAIAQEQGNAAFQSWVQRINARLKVENHLNRWESKTGAQ